MTPKPYEHLPAALNRLTDALSALFEPHTRHTDSPYVQLAAAIPGTQGNSRHIPGSSPPLNLDAVDLKNEIDTALHIWQLSTRKWRPQDVGRLEQTTAIIRMWCKRIDILLNPVHAKQISAACPACNRTHVYRTNSSGEKVRQPALQVIAATGCQCLACHAFWSPEKYLLLCRVLGFDVPTGVLE